MALPDSFFRKLHPPEEAEFRQWARDPKNFDPGPNGAISPVWHPVVQDECRLLRMTCNSKLVRTWECKCGHTWEAKLVIGGLSQNVSGEATNWCPVCGERPLCGSDAHPPTEAE